MSLIEAFTELESLLSQALRSPDEVTEIERGESTWKMHRNPSRGRSIELTEFHSAQPTGARVVEFISGTEPCDGYPDDLPFVVGHHTHFQEQGTSRTVVWRPDPSYIAPPRPAITPEGLERMAGPAMKALSEQIEDLLPKIGAGDEDARAELALAFEKFRVEHSEEAAEFRSMWDSVFQAPDADEARGARFRALVADCEGAGWQQLGEAEPEVPSHAAGVCLERQGIRRELHSIALGPIQILVLRDQSP